MAPTVRSNTHREDLLLAAVELFRRQYSQVHPERQPLLLCPKNEAGVQVTRICMCLVHS
jgi:hypothetical protein